MKYDAGFIGAGNMGLALLTAVGKTGAKIGVTDHHPEKEQAAKDLANAAAEPLLTLVKESRFLFLGVKPYAVEALCREISPVLPEETVLVSMAAGRTVAEVQAAASHKKVVRILPNTPVSVGAGVTVYCKSEDVTPDEEEALRALLKESGAVDPLPENKMDAASALSGSSPAFVYLFAEALADGAVAAGLPRDKADFYAAKTLEGAAALLLSSGRHPGKLKDEVCSPGGSTIEGVRTLSRGGFQGLVADAVVDTYEKAKKL